MTDETMAYDSKKSLFPDSYWGRLSHSYVKYHPRNLFYGKARLREMNEELQEYERTGVTKRTNAQLWEMHYILEANTHPETREPLPILFRWSAYCPVNIPIIVGISVLAPTPFNQFFFQTVNQTYNFGINICNSSSSNKKSTSEIAVSYLCAVTSAIGGSVGLRKVLEMKNPTSKLGKFTLNSTPFIGLVIANSVNLLFSRSKELKEGILIDDPKSGKQIPELKSKAASRKAFFESLLLRLVIPIPSFIIPIGAARYATKNFKFYKNPISQQIYNGAVAYFTIWASLVFAMSFFKPIGYIKKSSLEKEIRDYLVEASEDQIIQFAKGI